jgi:hypothetical protein
MKPRNTPAQHDIRRPGLERLAARLREANPTWTDARCIEEAKAMWAGNREDELAKRPNDGGMAGWWQR